MSAACRPVGREMYERAAARGSAGHDEMVKAWPIFAAADGTPGYSAPWARLEMTRIEDLTPAELRQVRAGRANTSARGASPRTREKAASPNGFTCTRQGEPPREPKPPIWGCHYCPATFTALATAQRHCDTEGHPRLDWLPGKKEPANG